MRLELSLVPHLDIGRFFGYHFLGFEKVYVSLNMSNLSWVLLDAGGYVSHVKS